MGKLYGLLMLTVVTLGQSCGATTAGNRREGAAPGRGSFNAGAQVPGNRGGAGPKDYADPDGAFSIRLPHGWEVKREEKDDA